MHDPELQPHAAQIRAFGHLWLAFYARHDHSVAGSNVVALEAQATLKALQQSCLKEDVEVIVLKKTPGTTKIGVRKVTQRPRTAKPARVTGTYLSSDFCRIPE
jgi:hypothetical protein